MALFKKKGKARQIQVQKQELSEKQKNLLEEIVEALRLAKTKEEAKGLTLFLTLFAGASLGRIALHGIPSVEPIIPLAVIAGLLFGMKEGFTLGGGAYLVSNFFVWGLQGPWTIFQAAGAAVAGALGGLYGRVRKPTWKEVAIISVIGTVFYEVVMNLAGSVMGLGLFGLGLAAIPLYFAASLPFSLAHIITNCAFARLFSPLLKYWRNRDEFKMVSISRVDGDNVTNLRMYKSE